MVSHGGAKMVIYKIIDIVGVSEKSFADAAKSAVDEATKTVRGIKRAEVVKFDLKVENDNVTKYRAEVKISFEIEK
jgi:flavin-binding protein dodecin